MNVMTKVYQKQAEKERSFVPVQDRVGVSVVVRMIQHVRELGSAITRQTQELRLITNGVEIGRCADKEKYGGSAHSVCAIIDEGMKEDKMLKTYCLNSLMTVNSSMKVEEVHKDGDHEDMDAELQEAWGDVSCAALDLGEVRRARLKEIRYIGDKKVQRRILRQEALRRGYKIVKGRWIDVSEGDSNNWKYRSRYVAKEFNTGDEDGFFASTPQPEVLRLVISDAARDQEEDKVLMVNDVARVCFEAPGRRTICAELFAEETHERDDVGLLLQSLYGTTDASANFQEEVRKVSTKAGFKRGKYNPSTYYHLWFMEMTSHHRGAGKL